jgi:hypothetical protein
MQAGNTAPESGKTPAPAKTAGRARGNLPDSNLADRAPTAVHVRLLAHGGLEALL